MAFDDCSQLQTASISKYSQLESIGEYAFEDCSSLTSFLIPSKVERVLVGAFFGCSNIRELSFYCKNIGDWFDSSKEKVEEILIGKSVETIQAEAFYSFTLLNTLMFEDDSSLKEIGDEAFYGCDALKEVNLPESLETIGSSAFYSCDALETIELPKTLKMINLNAFNYCNAVKDVYAYMPKPFGIDVSVFSTTTYNNAVLRVDGVADKYRKRFAWSKFFHIINIGETPGEDDGGIDSENSGNSGGGQYTTQNYYYDLTAQGNGEIVVDEYITQMDLGMGASWTQYFEGLTVRDEQKVIEIPHFPGTGVPFKFIPDKGNVLKQVLFSSENNGTLQDVTSGLVYDSSISGYTYQAVDHDSYPKLVAVFEEKGGQDQPDAVITYADANVKAICVSNWDTDGDGELSKDEAAAVTSLGDVFKLNDKITSFDELQYFTGLTKLDKNVFTGCTSIKSLIIPVSVTSIGNSAFSGCSSLVSISIPDNVTSIEDGAFEECSSLENVTIPENLTYVGVSAFEGTPWYNTWYNNQPDGLVYLGKVAFKYKGVMPENTSIVLRDGTSMISDELFWGCGNLISIEIPNSVKSIGFFAFSYSGLSSIKIPNSTTSIGGSAFAGCDGLKSIAIPDGVTTIEQYTFAWCHSLMTVVIPKSIKYINEYSFDDCSSLTSFFIEKAEPVWPRYGEDSPFSGSNIRNATLYVPKGCVSAFSNADYWKNFKEIKEFVKDEEVTYAIEDNTVILEAASDQTQKEIVIPSSVSIDGESYPVTAIDKGAFENNMNMEQVTIPESVMTIGDDAFAGCTSLKAIYCYVINPIPLNSSVFAEVNKNTCKLYIPFGSAEKYRNAEGWGDFKNIVEMEDNPNNITFVDAKVKAICLDKWDSDKDGKVSKAEAAAVTSLGDVFMFNDEITSFDELQYFTGLTKLDDNEFTRCTSLTSLTIPASVTSIVGSALGGCSSLTSFKLADGNNSFTVDNGILYNKEKTILICCPAGKTGALTLPESVKEIGANGFYNCTQLTSVNLPSSVEKIGDGAFVGCSGLTSFNIPASLRQYYLGLGEGAFTGCTNLTAFTVDATNTNYQAVNDVLFELNNNTPIALVAYPNKKGDKYTIPEMTAIIRDYAFCMTDIKELVFTGMLQSIGDNAFACCQKLEKVTTNTQIPSHATFASAFSNSTGTAKLYVPKGTKPLYLALAGWNSFGSNNIIESSGEGSPMFFVDDASGNFYQVLDDGESVALIWNQSPSSPTSFTIPSSVTHGGATYTVTTVGSEENVVFDDLKMPIVGDRYSQLASLEIPNTVKKFRDYAFYRCPLTSLVIPNSVEEIGAWSFQCYDKMKSLTLGTGLKTIGRRAFAGCAAQTLTIPEGVTSIGAEAFIYSMALKTLTLPSTLKSIGSYAFGSCISLETIYNYAKNPAALVNTDNDANYKPWLAFASIDLDVCALWVPKGSKSNYMAAEGWKLFSNTQEMEGSDTEIITFADANVKAICVENWDTDGDGELSMDEAATVTSIGTLFKNNSQITSFDELQYFTGLTVIEESAFEDCNNLMSISIPSNVTSIGDRAFFDCSNLKSVVSYIMEPFNIMPNVFRKIEYTPLSGGTWEEEYVSSSATLYVPIGTLEKYKALSGFSYLSISGTSYYSNGWTMFARMVEMKLGDANGDRTVDEDDVTTMADYIIGKNVDNCYELNADLNGDKEVNVADIVELNNLLGE